MSTTVILVAVVVLLLIVVIAGQIRFREKYRRREALLTRPEVAFLWALERAIATNERVMAKVRLIDVLEPAGKPRAFVRARSRLREMHVDFVVCHRDTLVIRYGVQLDGREDDSPAQRERDAFLEMAMKSAGVALHRVRSRERFEPVEVQRALGITPGRR